LAGTGAYRNCTGPAASSSRLQRSCTGKQRRMQNDKRRHSDSARSETGNPGRRESGAASAGESAIVGRRWASPRRSCQCCSTPLGIRTQPPPRAPPPAEAWTAGVRTQPPLRAPPPAEAWTACHPALRQDQASPRQARACQCCPAAQQAAAGRPARPSPTPLSRRARPGPALPARCPTALSRRRWQAGQEPLRPAEQDDCARPPSRLHPSDWMTSVWDPRAVQRGVS
jgi:hypothetical protein